MTRGGVFNSTVIPDLVRGLLEAMKPESLSGFIVFNIYLGLFRNPGVMAGEFCGIVRHVRVM